MHISDISLNIEDAEESSLDNEEGSNISSQNEEGNNMSRQNNDEGNFLSYQGWSLVRVLIYKFSNIFVFRKRLPSITT